MTSRALLLTDVVDSTKLAERVGDDRMAQIWVAHDRAVRDLLGAWRGLEIDRTDGFLMLFDDVADAVGFGTAVHAELAEVGERFGVPFAARVGVHWGAVILIESSAADRARGAKPLEVEGLAKPLAARVMSVAAGGQTLLTAEARARLGPGVATVSHGHWRMKGVSEPVELFEVASPGAPLAPPPDSAKVYRVVRSGEHWLPVREVRSHLPVERDAFVGREEDLRSLAELLDSSRLVSVLGIGGTGKTRLVTRFAWTWLGDFPGGAWFCDLSEARSVEGICGAVARALDVPLGKDDPVVQLGHAIAGRGECLVVLDNFEQVARHAPETVGRWLDRARDARFVATTREVLGLPGESALALAPLEQDDAVDLFVARAKQAKADFAPTDQASVRALVTLLDSLPLAIELAAARVRVMPPKTLLARMSERFKLLASAGGRHTRQATLRGALDWSWDLLSADEQAALAQLSVFEGGFTLEAAEGVLALADMWPTDAVQALVDKSLVRRVADDRFDLLVSVQEYAAEKLDGSSSREGAERRHGGFFAAMGTGEALRALAVHGGLARRRVLVAELDNLVVGCRRAARRSEGDAAARLFCAVWSVLDHRGPFAVAVGLGDELAALTLPPRARARVETCIGAAMRLLGRSSDAARSLETVLAIARDEGDRDAEGKALSALGLLHTECGRPDEAEACIDAALAAYRQIGSRPGEGSALGNLGALRAAQGRSEAARAAYDAALAAHRETGDRNQEGIVLGNLGALLGDMGRMDEARRCYDAAIVMDREAGNRRIEAVVLGNLGNLHRDQGRNAEAGACYDASLALAREVGERRLEGVVLGELGRLLANQGRLDQARAHHELALAIHREVGNRRAEGSTLTNLATVHALQGRPDEASAVLQAALGVHRAVGNRRAEGVALGNLGLLHQGLGRQDEAQEYLDAALILHREVGNRPLEAVALLGLGNLHEGRGRSERARASYEAASAVAREVGDQRLEGAVHTAIGASCLAQGDPAGARASFATAERLLRATHATVDLALLLCRRAGLEAREGHAHAARACLSEAEALAGGTGAGTGSDLLRRIAETRAVVEAP